MKHTGHSGWGMLACCVPMVVIAVALVATGVVPAGFLLFAAICVGAMFAMMRLMPGADEHNAHDEPHGHREDAGEPNDRRRVL